MSGHPSPWSLLAALLVGLGLGCAPRAWADLLRATVRDALQPGQRLARQAEDWCLQAWNRTAAPGPGITASLSAPQHDFISQARLQQLEAEVALLRNRLQQATHQLQSGQPPRTTAPLILHELTEARVLGTETVQHFTAIRSPLLSVGVQQGITESDLVLAAHLPHLDLGRDARLQPDQVVLAGRTLVGRISQVGKYSSTFLPITDEKFRGLAQLARRAELGFELGASGILEGAGSHGCRLNFIQSTEPVSVGDSVYSAPRDGSEPGPFLYGKVVSAKLLPGAPHWTIEVAPATDLSQLREVQVVSPRINSARLAAH